MEHNFYKSIKWKHKREIIFKRDEYLCQECKRYGKTTSATIVHHIYPLEQKPELGLVNENLISLCNTCHDKMHNRTGYELSELGLEWVRRIEKKISPPHSKF